MRCSQPEERRSFAKLPSRESKENIFKGSQPLYAGFTAKPVPDNIEKPVGLHAVDNHPVVEGIVKEVVRIYKIFYILVWVHDFNHVVTGIGTNEIGRFSLDQNLAVIHDNQPVAKPR